MKRLFGAVIALALLTFFFQNCGKAGFENQDLSSELNTAADVDPKLAKLPFPYDISVNQIAHMTCPINQQNPNSSYFSWKVGAFDNPADVPTARLGIRPSGLRLSDKFLTEWNKLAATYSSTFQESKFKEALLGLPSIANTQVQLSFRKPSTPRTTLMALPNGGESPTTTLLPVISTDPIVSSFATNHNAIVNYFPAARDFESRSMEASMLVPSAQGSYDSALKANYDGSFMTLGFLMPGDGTTDNVLSAPGTDDRFAYGKGYRVHFGVANPHQGTNQYPTSDSLSVVEEYDLESGYPSGVGWDCSYKFKVVQKADRYKATYRANHFSLINGQCPTKEVTSSYCPSSYDARFGINSAYFEGGKCPGGVAPVTGTHCEEQYSPACPDEPYSADLNNVNPIMRQDGVYHPSYPNRPAILHALRRFLPPDQWDINVSRNCIVPKFEDNSCYPNATDSAPVVYDELFFPFGYSNVKFSRFIGCGGTFQSPCAAYLTLCIRR